MARLKLTLVLNSGARIGPGKAALLESVRDDRLDLGRRPRHGHGLQARLAPGRQPQPRLRRRRWSSAPPAACAAAGPRLTAFGEELLARYRRLEAAAASWRPTISPRWSAAPCPTPARRSDARHARWRRPSSLGYRYGDLAIAIGRHGGSGSGRHRSETRGAAAASAAGPSIGTLGGLIGLGGAEFRLPLLIGAFRFAALEAVILNKAMSLVVVASALPFRAAAVPFEAVAAHWAVIVNLLAGSLLGAWLGAGWATRLRSETLYRVIAVLLVAIAAVLLLGHDAAPAGEPLARRRAPGRRRRGRRVRDRRCRLAPRRRRRRAADPDAGPAVRRRHQARRQPVAGGEPADDARRLHPLQPRPELRRARAQPRASCWSWRPARSRAASSAASCSASSRAPCSCRCSPRSCSSRPSRSGGTQSSRTATILLRTGPPRLP